MTELDRLVLAGISFEVVPDLGEAAATWDSEKQTATIAAAALESLSIANTVQWVFDQALNDMLRRLNR